MLVCKHVYEDKKTYGGKSCLCRSIFTITYDTLEYIYAYDGIPFIQSFIYEYVEILFTQSYIYEYKEIPFTHSYLYEYEGIPFTYTVIHI